MLKVTFYHLPSGRVPVIEFMETLPETHAASLARDLKLLEELPIVPTNKFKKLKNNELWEVVSHHGKNQYRILGAVKNKKEFIAAHGFKKKTQKTPLNEIRTALRRIKDT